MWASYTNHLNAHTYYKARLFYTASSTHIIKVKFYGQICKISINMKVLDDVTNRSQTNKSKKGREERLDKIKVQWNLEESGIEGIWNTTLIHHFVFCLFNKKHKLYKA